MKKKKRAPTLLEQLVARESTETLTASTSLAIRKVAEDIAREALEAPGFREDLRRLVSQRMRVMLDEPIDYERLVACGTQALGEPVRRARPRRIPWWVWQIASLVSFALAMIAFLGMRLGWWT